MTESMMNRAIRVAVAASWTYGCIFMVLPMVIHKAYDIRLYSLKEYGNVIHEFDPYFNFRATEYLYEHGWQKFCTWFDYQSWYPLGRPVGTTIYPGMQVTAVFLKNHVLPDMSLNDICCYIPAWFGAIASVLTGLIAYECSLPLFDKQHETTDQMEPPFGSILTHIPLISWLYKKTITPIITFFLKGITLIFGSDLGLASSSVVPTAYTQKKMIDLSSPAVEIGLIAASIMAIIPAHMMRSIAGGYDNESVANTAMTMTFYCWCRTLRGGKDFKGVSTFVWATLAAFSYFYMVAVWGGYVFVTNLIGVHAGILVLLGRFGPKLHRAYTIFYALGTFLAIQVPVVGYTPLKSLEQLGPALMFGGFQLLAFCEYKRKKGKLNKVDAWKLRIAVFAIAAVFAGVAAYFLDRQFGYFAPMSSRVRGLFVKHTKTGNPLVDSVAEHQPANAQAYDQYLSTHVVKLAPYGFALIALRYFNDASSFLLVYTVVTYFFSAKMVRLILLTAPIASILCGVVLGRVGSFFFYNFLGSAPSFFDIVVVDDKDTTTAAVEQQASKKGTGSGKKKGNSKNADSKSKKVNSSEKHLNIARSLLVKAASVGLAYYLANYHMMEPIKDFMKSSTQIAVGMSHPTIIQKASLRDSGKTVYIDDYRECYNWVRKNTPEDARIMAWWDYGYQITSIANRTTIADGNTWNHEHIALLGRALTASEKEGHRIARHLADYVLVWAGGGGDDLAKSPHLARIASSVYRDHCPNDPLCSNFGFSQHGPTPMMRESLLFKLHSHGHKGVSANASRFRHAFDSKYGKCRVFKVLSVSRESKKWVADPENRDCDAPGSWYCRGQYPPGMMKILSEKKDFSQLEDFNKDTKDSEYQKQYFDNLNNKPRHTEKPNPSNGPKKQPWKPKHEVTQENIDKLNSLWSNTENTDLLWTLISQNRVGEFMDLVAQNPESAHIRSADGRGPMWWAMEAGNTKIVRVLKRLRVSDTLKDGQGMTPSQVKKEKDEL